jgi:predicted  nucleic acid-binding Zn-ribbon protein
MKNLDFNDVVITKDDLVKIKWNQEETKNQIQSIDEKIATIKEKISESKSHSTSMNDVRGLLDLVLDLQKVRKQLVEKQNNLGQMYSKCLTAYRLQVELSNGEDISSDAILEKTKEFNSLVSQIDKVAEIKKSVKDATTRVSEYDNVKNLYDSI